MEGKGDEVEGKRRICGGKKESRWRGAFDRAEEEGEWVGGGG